MKKRRSRFMGGVAALALAGTLTVAGPATPASAANSTPCAGRTDLLKVTWHYGARLGALTHSACYANKGRIPKFRSDLPAWVTEIKTGNNNITFNDANGDKISKGKYQVWDWHKHPHHLKYIDIR